MTRRCVIGLALALGFAVGAALHHLAGAAVAHRVGLFALCAAVGFQAVSILLQHREQRDLQELERQEAGLFEAMVEDELRLERAEARRAAADRRRAALLAELRIARNELAAKLGLSRIDPPDENAPWDRIFDTTTGLWLRWDGRRWVPDAGGDHGQR